MAEGLSLVVGGTGFIGRYVVAQLLDRGKQVRVLSRSGRLPEVWQNRSEVEARRGDITDPASLSTAAEGVSHVYHLAACGHVSALSEEAYAEFTRVNVEGTKNLLRACSGGSVEKFVHFSSTAAMGLIRSASVDEETPAQPVTPYQRSKLESEQVAFACGRELGVPICVVRPCMVYGPGGKGEFHKITSLMRRGLFPRVGTGRNLTPLVHARDVATGAIAAAEHGQDGQVYLLTSRNSIPLEELRRLALQAWGKRAPAPFVPVSAMFAIAWAFERLASLTGGKPMATRQNIASTVWDREFSIERARNELGYEPKVSFEQGIAETIEWFKQETGGHV